jgi:septal ring-binding cell division protein DamX
VAQVQDEGFHEIQLNGKQLVFLFMAATVVSVVIFLCGVLVGRGVRAERGLVADTASAASSAETAPPAPAATAAPAPTPAGSDPTKAAPPPPADDLTYFNRLEKSSAASEKLKAAPERAVPPVVKPAPAPPAPAQKTVPAPVETHAESQAPAEPSGSGFAVQIAALNVRSEADAIAKRLSSKGYAAYVLSPASGTPTVFRVRVGKFPTRREAETVASKLQKEEQFKPWVTR